MEHIAFMGEKRACYRIPPAILHISSQDPGYKGRRAPAIMYGYWQETDSFSFKNVTIGYSIPYYCNILVISGLICCMEHIAFICEKRACYRIPPAILHSSSQDPGYKSRETTRNHVWFLAGN